MAITVSPRELYRTAAQRVRVLDTTAITFTRARATQAAAGLAYYTFFSIFPLMLLFIVGGSYFLDQTSVFQRVTQAVQNVLPISQQFISDNLREVLQQRTAVGILVLISLLWSASNVFNSLAYNINLAWPEARQRNFLQTRLIGMSMIASLVGLLLLSVALDWLAKRIDGFGFSRGPLDSGNPLATLCGLASWTAVFLLYLAMYRWLPTISMAWVASFWGALAASIGWKAATTGFAWYLASPFARYQLVYGSLGAIVAFLFLIYIIALVTLFGAHLAAAVDHLHKEREGARVGLEEAALLPGAEKSREDAHRAPVEESRSTPEVNLNEGEAQAEEDGPRPTPDVKTDELSD